MDASALRAAAPLSGALGITINRMRRLLLIATLSPALASAATCFPQSDHSKSPTGNSEIEWNAPTDGQTHHLSLRKDGSASESKPFIQFSRSACVVWAPDGNRFALVLNSESTDATTLVYRTSDLAHPIQIAQQFSQTTQEHLRTFGHLYVRPVEWTPSGILIEITGHDDLENGMSIQKHVLCKPQDEGYACDA